jgi:hypothetical protein
MRQMGPPMKAMREMRGEMELLARINASRNEYTKKGKNISMMAYKSRAGRAWKGSSIDK